MIVLSAYEHIYDDNYRYTLGDLFYETTRNFIKLDTQSYNSDMITVLLFDIPIKTSISRENDKLVNNETNKQNIFDVHLHLNPAEHNFVRSSIVIFFPKGRTGDSEYTKNMKKCAIETFKDTLEITEKRQDSIINRYIARHTPIKIWKGHSNNFLVYIFLNANRLDIMEMSLKNNVSATSIPSSQEDSRMYSKLRTAYQLSCITYELLFVHTKNESDVRAKAENEVSSMPKNSPEARLHVLNAVKNARKDVKQKTKLIDFITNMYSDIETFHEINENKNYANNECKSSILDLMNIFDQELHKISSPIAMSRARSPSILSSVSSKPKKICTYCKKTAKEAGITKFSYCSACTIAPIYCNKICQKADWGRHKKECEANPISN